MMKQEIQRLFISKDTSLKNALQKMDEIGRKLLIVMDENLFYSLLSIGDIQRAIIRENNLNLAVWKILRQNVKVAFVHDDLDKTRAEMKRRRNEFMPVLTPEGRVKDVIFWEDLFKAEKRIWHDPIDLPVVIMAGGKGTRLRPLTNVLPKALIPLGKKTMLEHIMDSFLAMGSNRFFISVNHKSDMIEYYMQQVKEKNYRIEYFKETKPLGTAGSLYLLKGKLMETFFVSNCDILIDQDYSDIFAYHNTNSNDITLVAAIRNYPIAYGIIHTRENGLLDSIEEKPELSFKINTGFYIMEPSLLDEIPDNQYYDITELIKDLQGKGKKIGVFPVSEKSWMDVGTWKEYLSNHVSEVRHEPSNA